MLAHSLRLVLPMITAPALRNRAATKASFGAGDPVSAREPAVVCIAVRGVDIVFDEYRDAMKRPAGALRLALLVERVSDLESIGVELNDGVDHGSSFVHLSDTRQILLGHRARGILAGLEAFLKIVNRDLIEFEVFSKTLDVWRGCGRWIDNASRAQRRVSSRGQSRSHPSTKEVAARVVFRREGIGRHQGSCDMK